MKGKHKEMFQVVRPHGLNQIVKETNNWSDDSGFMIVSKSLLAPPAGSGSGIGKNISGRIGYGSGTGICIVYLINRVLSGSENLDRVFFGYLSTSYLSHGT